MRKRILIIDDDELVVQSVCKILEREGYDSVTSHNALDAIQRTASETFDLIISDIRMPGKNGVAAVMEIQKLFEKQGKGNIPIIFITGYAEMVDQLRAVHLGEVILKPFDLDRLIVTIREYL